MMNAADVVGLYISLEEAGITIWLDGGWGVDANLGKQTRPHGDVDIFVQLKDVLSLRGFLTDRGYREIKLEIARPHNFVFGDGKSREVDIHVIEFDSKGSAVYGSGETREIFPVSVFEGTGVIAGLTVRCITPEQQVQWHTGYKLRESDYKDVAALCAKFSLDYPPGYERLMQTPG